MQTIDASYDPADDKLRLRASQRLDAETYARVKAAGFGWAPKQQLFFAIWSPAREDLALELAGEIEDEDTSLVDRATERADRFSGYQESRAEDADRARAAVSAIAENIPLGQPILIGHHSEKHARRDAEKIENGMRRAVQMWKTSEYWRQRAHGAIAHAKYLEQPAVRARRIKKLEAEQRKAQKALKEAELFLRLWTECPDRNDVKKTDGSPASYAERAAYLVRRDWACSMEFSATDIAEGRANPEDARKHAMDAHSAAVADRKRWLEHYENRLAYERAMLAGDGGTVADQTKPEKGGACKCWVALDAWLIIQKVNKVSVTVLDNWGNGGRDFTRTISFDKLNAVMSRDAVDGARAAGRVVESQGGRGFYLTNEAPRARDTHDVPAAPVEIAAMQATLKNGGVKTVVAPQLFPTPPEIVAQMIEAAEIEPWMTVLEPSAGTGNIAKAVRAAYPDAHLDMVEINHDLCEALKREFEPSTVACHDFLEVSPPFCPDSESGFDRILMNPPFSRGQDIEHILHALQFLRPGGRLVAICAGGPQQEVELKPLAETWKSLPEGTFASQGTNVRTVMLTIEK
jgi:phospholipid N-methyltransferase